MIKNYNTYKVYNFLRRIIKDLTKKVYINNDINYIVLLYLSFIMLYLL